MDKVLQYAVARTVIEVSFAISGQGAVIDNCTYCPYRSNGGGYCYLYRRSMADDNKCRPFFCGLAFCEVRPDVPPDAESIPEKAWTKGAF